MLTKRVFVVYLLLFSSLHALDLINVENLPLGIESGKYVFAHYNGENDMLFITLKSDSINADNRGIGMQTDDKLNIVFSMKKSKKSKSVVGIPNSRKIGGIIDPTYYISKGDSLYVYDMQTSRINVFSISFGTTSFKHIIDVDSVMSGYMFNIINNKLYGSLTYDHFKTMNSGFCASVENDKNFKKSRVAKIEKEFYSYDKYRKHIKYEEKFPKEWTDGQKSFMEILTTDCSYGNVIFEQLNDGLFLAANTYGIDLFMYNENNEIIKSTEIEDFSLIRKKEIEIVRSRKYAAEGWGDIYSKLNRVIVDKKDKLIFCSYKMTSGMTKELGHKRYFICYDLDSFNPVSKLIPLDFDPIGYDDGLIIGIKKENGKLFLSSYKIEGV